MNWNHVWELFKINLLYANPQAVTNLQKRQEKKKKANFSIVNAMLRQQLLILIIFTVVYSYLFVGVDYKANPGVLTLYLLTFSVMGLLQTFTALYSTFYDSKDSKAYLPLPLKPSEVFLAKTLSGSMVGMTFMVPILSLLILAYWQFIGPLGIVVGLLSFIVSLFMKLLESQGVEILTCGTCLNHYGLTEKLSVGGVTNMYVICEKMLQAEKVVKP